MKKDIVIWKIKLQYWKIFSLIEIYWMIKWKQINPFFLFQQNHFLSLWIYSYDWFRLKFFLLISLNRFYWEKWFRITFVLYSFDHRIKFCIKRLTKFSFFIDSGTRWCNSIYQCFFVPITNHLLLGYVTMLSINQSLKKKKPLEKDSIFSNWIRIRLKNQWNRCLQFVSKGEFQLIDNWDKLRTNYMNFLWFKLEN